jgi:hypothetical protein
MFIVGVLVALACLRANMTAAAIRALRHVTAAYDESALLNTLPKPTQNDIELSAKRVPHSLDSAQYASHLLV